MQLKSNLDEYQLEFLEELSILEDLISSTIYYNNENNKLSFEEQNYGPLEVNITLSELLKRANLNPVLVLTKELAKIGSVFNKDVVYTAAIATKYEGYINRSIVESEKLNRLSKKILNLDKILSSNQISFECKSRINLIRPENFGQLQRMEGIRPATLAYVAGNIL
jgi:tRNA uridine 5-carboxymethylaminomethyl modification enzyme